MRRALLAVSPGVRRSLLQRLQAASAFPAAAPECSSVAHRAGALTLHSSRLSSTQTEGSGASNDASIASAAGSAPAARDDAADAAQQLSESQHSTDAVPSLEADSSAPAASAATDSSPDAAAVGSTQSAAQPQQPEQPPKPPRVYTPAELERISQENYAVQLRMGELMEQKKPAEVVRIFEEHAAQCAARAAEAQAAPDSLELRALRPKHTSYKIYIMAVKAARMPHAMARLSEQIGHMWKFGHVPNMSVYEPALAAALPMDRRLPTQASDAIPAGRMIADMLERGLQPNGQCFFLAIMANAQAKELTMASWLVRQLGEGKADLTNMPVGGLRSCLTATLLACARTRRLDDAAYVMSVAEKLGIRIYAGALQAIFPFVVEALRTDILRPAIESIAHQTTTHHRQTMPIKMDEGTLLAVLNAAARKADAHLARLTWDLLERSLVQPALRPLTALRDDEADSPQADAQPPAPSAAPPGAAATGTSAATGVSQAAAAAAGDATGTVLPAEAAEQQTEQLQQPQQPGQPQQQDQMRQPQDWDSSGASADLTIPCIPAFHAMVHALAKADDLRGAFSFVRQLQKRHPDAHLACAWHSLSPLVDSIAPSVAQIDAAYFVLEDMHAKGEEVTVPMLNAVIAACAQVGDLARAFETFEAASTLGLTPDVDTYNALIWGCLQHGQNASTLKLLEELRTAGLQPNGKTHELLVDSAVVAADVPSMLAALQDMAKAGFQPGIRLLERCVMRAERAADVPALRLLMGRLDLLNYKIVGAAAKLRRWEEEGGMPVLVGKERFVSRPMSGGYKHPDIIRSSAQQVDGSEGLEPDIALEDWTTAPQDDAAAQA